MKIFTIYINYFILEIISRQVLHVLNARSSDLTNQLTEYINCFISPNISCT